MKYIRFLIAGIFAVAVFYALNSRLGSVPPLGKFLYPAGGFWQNEQSLDHSKDDVVIAGLHAPVQVHYDGNLIPHVFAQNDADLYRAQGYITARHRLWQMEFQTHAAAGRISEIIGSEALEYDRRQRRKGMGYGAEKALEAMRSHPQTIAALEAYRDGVNAWINKLEPKDYPVEYKLLDYAPEAWTLEKSAYLLMYMTDMLAGGDNDLEYTNFLKKYGRERFDLLYPEFFDVVDPVIPTQKEWGNWEVNRPEVPEDQGFPDFNASGMPGPDPDNGSNNWAVAPEKSYSGNALLANDPHLGLNLPSIWFAMQLATPDKNTMGVSLPGTAGIIIGFNENISWGGTNATRDVRDWYKIDFRDDSKSDYRYGDEWRPTSKRVEEIKLRGEVSFYDTVIYTHHGPVAYDDIFRGLENRMGYAMKWTGHLGGNILRTFLELNEARDYQDFESAISHFTAPGQNFIFVSTGGDIALWAQGLFPNKWEGQGKFLLDGSNPQHDWQGFVPQEHNAHVKNPEQGFISSANQHPVDASYPYYVFNDGYETYRNRVINEFLRSKDSLSISDFKALQNNMYNLKAAELLPHMLEKMEKAAMSETEQNLLRELAEWDYNNEAGEIAPSIWEAWWGELERLTWDELQDDSLALKLPFSYQTVFMLKEHPEHEFMDIDTTEERETAKDLFLISYKRAVKNLEDWEQEYGDYHWGDYKGTYAGHLLQGLPAFSRFDIPIGGNRGIVNAAGKNHGPSWRMIVEMSSPPRAWGIYPGGQSGNPGSRFYDNLIDKWAGGDYLELRFLENSDDTEHVIFTQILTAEE